MYVTDKKAKYADHDQTAQMILVCIGHHGKSSCPQQAQGIIMSTKLINLKKTAKKKKLLQSIIFLWEKRQTFTSKQYLFM
jgi:hypothetical protein